MPRNDQIPSHLFGPNPFQNPNHGCSCSIPPNFGMLLSRSWAAKLKGSLQMDMSYATFPVFGVHRRLFREKKLSYMVTSAKRPNNHPIYSVDTEMGSTIFFTEGGKDSSNSQNSTFVPT